MTAFEKEELKGVVREMMREDKNFFRNIVREILEEDLKSSEPDRRAKIDAIIKRDFARYENVFKALA